MKKNAMFCLAAFCCVLVSATTVHAAPKDWKQNRAALAKIAGIDRPFWAPNRIGDYITNNGQIISNIPTSSAGMEWPVGSNNHIGYASGIWLAGIKDGEVVSAVGEYSVEYQPGIIKADGTADDPNDPRFKVYIINDEDIADPSGNPDYLNWPVADGAPAGADGKPLLLGTSTAWAVFNDLDDSLHTRLFDSAPMGVEVQMTAWGYDRPDALGDIMFIKFLIINKGGGNISDAYVAFWADIDIGDALDLVGCDTTLSLGYNYKTQVDGYYGTNPPALGYDFLQGPIVPSSAGDTANVSGRKLPGFKNLQLTSFNKYIGGGPSQFQDPGIAIEAYNYMRGFDRLGDPIIDPTTGQPTKFWHPGDPVAGTGWVADDHDDKRFLMSSGPFAMAAGDSQEVVLGIIIAQGKTGLESVALLKSNDLAAQNAYDRNFAVPVAPPSPVVTAHPDTGAILLTWDDAVESYTTTDYFAVDEDGNPAKFTFQGYNVYQLDEPVITAATKIKKVASFDVTDGVVHIRDDVFIPELGQVGNIIVQDATDNGIQRYLRITKDAFSDDAPLIDNQPYYFAVTAYIYKPYGTKVLESAKQVITARPQMPPLGTQWTTPAGDTLNVSHTGPSDASIYPVVLSPAALTGHTYEVRFRETPAGVVYDIWDMTTNVRKDSNRTNNGDLNRPYDYPIVDGVFVKVLESLPGFARFLTVANAAGPINPPTSGCFSFNASGFPTPDGLPPNPGVNDRPVNQQTNGSTWGIHTADNGTRSSYSSFVSRVSLFYWPRIVPYDWEIRFTTTGSVAYDAFVTGRIFRVPFEIWRIGIGTPDDPTDDVRCVPYLLDEDESGTFNLCAVHQYGTNDHSISGGDNDPYTDWIYVAVPTDEAPGDAGYKAWEASALAIPGGQDDGSFYNVLARDNTLRRLVFVNVNGGSLSDPTFPANVNALLPETGTVFRIVTTKPNSPADVYSFTTVAPVRNDLSLARDQAAELVNVFPNPYNRSVIDLDHPADQFVTFTHLPEAYAKILIYTLSGDLVRRIEHTNATQFEQWDLRNGAGRKVGSGIYLASIDMGEIGQKVLKVVVY